MLFPDTRIVPDAGVEDPFLYAGRGGVLHEDAKYKGGSRLFTDFKFF